MITVDHEEGSCCPAGISNYGRVVIYTERSEIPEDADNACQSQSVKGIQTDLRIYDLMRAKWQSGPETY